jgi:hypothetical protein
MVIKSIGMVGCGTIGKALDKVPGTFYFPERSSSEDG